MSINIVKAEIADIDRIEELSQSCFTKFCLNDIGLEYCSKSVKKKIGEMLQSETFFVYVAKENDLIVGFHIAISSGTLYSDTQKQLVEIAMQSDPSLSQAKQSRIILLFIQNIERLSSELGIHITAFSICPQFDISENLIKKGYALSDKVLIKKMEVS